MPKENILKIGERIKTDGRSTIRLLRVKKSLELIFFK